MNLDTGTVMTALFFLLLCMVPFILMNISHRKKVKQNLQLLNKVAGCYHLTITNFDTWGNTSIGIDENADVVFFIKKTAEGDMAQ